MKEIILWSVLFTAVIIAGCSHQELSGREKLFNQIDQNKLLTEREKAFAKRSYELMAKVKEQDKSVNLENMVVIDINMFCPDSYRKWGLGNKSDFTIEEKLYLVALHQMSQTWEIYNTINLSELSDDEKYFLKEMHGKYGHGPINLKEETRKKQGVLEPQQETWFDLVSAPSGHKKLNDIDLIFLYRMTPR